MQEPEYLMESESESERLWIKSNHAATRAQLLDAGLLHLPENPTILDAGSGPGFVAAVIAEEIHKHYQASRLILVDRSQPRLEVAKEKIPKHAGVQVEFVHANIEKEIPLPEGSVDFIYSRFVFEYLSDPRKGLSELSRLLKPGGKIVLADLDYNCLTHYPMSPKLEDDLREIVTKLAEKKIFDPYIGRKLFKFLRDAKYTDIKVRMEAHHLFYRDLAESDIFNWQAKIKQIVSYQKAGALNLSFDAEKFGLEFMQLLKSPDRFSYTPIIIAEGIRPK